MEHARKLALVDPRWIVRSPPSLTDAIGKIMRRLDAEMTAVLDKTDLDDGEKEHLYNQVLQR